MRIFNAIGEMGGSDISVKLGVWASGDGKAPRQSVKPLSKFEIDLDGDKIQVAHNKSKTGVDYYYAQVNGVWMWTRDDISATLEYTVKAPEKAPKVEAKKDETPTTPPAPPTEEPKKREVKVIKKGAK